MKKFKKDESLKAAGAYREFDLWERFNNRGLVILVAFVCLYALFIYPIQIVVFEALRPANSPLARSFSQRLDAAGDFFSAVYNALLGGGQLGHLIASYYGPWFKAVLNGDSYASLSIFTLVGLAGTGFVAIQNLNPHRRTPNIYGDTRYAGEKDIEEMEKRDLIGFTKNLFVIGRFKMKNGKKKLLRMGETLSVLLLAPPSTGKSVGFVVPSIVTMDHACLFVNDQKPELWQMCSRHRANLGPTFQLRWSAQNEPDGRWVSPGEEKIISPDLLVRDAKGEIIRHPFSSEAKTKPIYYPSWNPISPKSIPGPGPKRDLYIERLVNVLCPDAQQGDKFWTSRARAALVGLIHFMVAKVEAATEDDLIEHGGSWRGIPEEWVGREASFPMLVDVFAAAQGEHDDGSDDPMRALFRAWTDEAREMNEAFHKARGIRPLNRAIIELTGLMGQPDKTRGSILTTVDEALNPFKNEAVRQRTMTTDFAFCELRGRPKAEARAREEKKVAEAKKNKDTYQPRYAADEFEPITIFISVNLEDAKAMATITGIFVDAANSYLVANPPMHIDDQGNQLGPYPFGFVLDEAPTLPKLDTVINGPAVGRSQKVFYIIVGQDYGQFEQKYSKPEVETLKSTTAIKIILSQNNSSTAKVISESSGKATIVKESQNDQKPKTPMQFGGALGDMLKYKKTTSSMSFDQVDFLKAADLMSLPPGKHIVQVQNFMNRPLLLYTPFFFQDPEVKPLVYNLRDFTGPAPVPPMSFELMERAAKRLTQSQDTAEASKATEEALNSPRHVIVATPQDIQALTKDEFGTTLPKSDLYAMAEVDLEPDAKYFDLPPEESYRVTNDVAVVAEFIGKNRVIMFDELILEEEINQPLIEAGLSPISADQLVSLNDIAQSINEPASPDVHYLGTEGGPNLDIPVSPERITPQFAISWIAEAMIWALGIKEHFRLFREEEQSDDSQAA